jgi:D-3-phosphoglycerate dehydrogenase
VAEHALGLMLAVANKIAKSDRDMRTVKNLQRFEYVGVEMQNKTVGIIGIGQIGMRTARMCKAAFGATILAYDPYLTAAQIAERGAQKVELDELLRRSDFISVHCPRTTESFGMLGKVQFEMMKPSAFFVTTARGGIHKEDDLYDVLKAREIAGAGVDVFLDEPPPLDHPLLTLDNVIVTPHNAGISEDALRAMAVGAAEQWITIFEGKVPPRLINPKAWPKYTERFQKIFGVTPPALV